MKKITNFNQAKKFLFTYIPQTAKKKYQGGFGLERTKYMLHLLEDPQEKIRIIHIAGTSGKGSTANFIAAILQSQGYKTGLDLSPHLLDMRERFYVDQKLISKQKFIHYLNDILPVLKQVEQSSYGMPSYFEILSVLVFYIFYKEKVDVAIVETGLGGLFDATNAVKNRNKIAVITKIGLDHMSVLGNSIKEIALQKAGIIHPFNTVFTISQSSHVLNVFKGVCASQQAPLHIIKANQHFAHPTISVKGSTFDFKFDTCSFPQIKLAMIGKHQIENCALALAVSLFIFKQDYLTITEKKLYQALKQLKFKGRFALYSKNKHYLVLDGAHNPQKMKAFLKALTTIFPDQKFDFILAFKHGKDTLRMLNLVCKLARNLYLTSFTFEGLGTRQFAQETQILTNDLKKIGFKNYKVLKNNEEIETLIEKPSNTLVITGSLYFLGEVYHRYRNMLK